MRANRPLVCGPLPGAVWYCRVVDVLRPFCRLLKNFPASPYQGATHEDKLPEYSTTNPRVVSLCLEACFL